MNFRNLAYLPFALLLAPVSAFGQAWSASTDFSAASNPSGAWSYQMASTVDGSRSLLTFAQSADGLDFWRASSDPFPASYPTVVHNPSSSPTSWGTGAQLAPGQLVMHPGDTEFVVVRWTAPATGTYRLQGVFGSIATESGTSADVRVLAAGAEVYTDYLNGTLGSTTTPFDLTFGLTVGETIDFVGGFGGDNFYNDGVSIDATIQAVPEPASLSALGIGALGFLKRRKKA